MALPFQTTLRWATEADFDALAEVMFAAVREGESPYTEAQRQAWCLSPAAARSGALASFRRRLLSQKRMDDARLYEPGGGRRILPISERKRGAQVCFASCSSAF